MRRSFWLVFFFFVFLDQLLKYLVVTQIEEGAISSSLVSITFYKNTGIAFGIPFAGWLVLLLTVGIIFYLLWHYRKLLNQFEILLGLSFVFAGAVGNGVDRVFRGFVVDYVAISVFPVFNLADVLIVGGVIYLLLYESVLTKNSNKKAV